MLLYSGTALAPLVTNNARLLAHGPRAGRLEFTGTDQRTRIRVHTGQTLAIPARPAGCTDGPQDSGSPSSDGRSPAANLGHDRRSTESLGIAVRSPRGPRPRLRSRAAQPFSNPGSPCRATDVYGSGSWGGTTPGRGAAERCGRSERAFRESIAAITTPAPEPHRAGPGVTAVRSAVEQPTAGKPCTRPRSFFPRDIPG